MEIEELSAYVESLKAKDEVTIQDLAKLTFALHSHVIVLWKVLDFLEAKTEKLEVPSKQGGTSHATISTSGFLSRVYRWVRAKL